MPAHMQRQSFGFGHEQVVNHPLACVAPVLATFLGWKEDICTIVNNEMRGFVVPTPSQPVSTDLGISPFPSTALLHRIFAPCRWTAVTR